MTTIASAPRALVAAALVTLLAFAAAPAAAGARAKPPTCKRPGTPTIAENATVRVLTREVVDEDSYFVHRTVLYGCLKKTGRSLKLAEAYDDDYVSSGQFELVAVRGRFVGFYEEYTDISCKSACPPDYEATKRYVTAIDLRHRRGRSSKVDSRPAEGRLLLDGRGRMVWPRWLEHNQVELRAFDPTGQYVVDSGAIHPESLALTPDGIVSWSNDGEPRTARLKTLTV